MEITIAVTVALILLLIFIPISVKVKAFASFSDRKIYYSIFIFGKLRVNSGFITFLHDRFIAHFSDKKALAVDYGKLMPGSSSPNPFKFVRISEIETSLVLNALESAESFMFSSMVNVFNSVIFVLLKRYRPTLTFRGNEFVTESDSTNGYYFETSFVFGIYSVLGYYISKIFKGLKNGKKQFGK